MVREVFSRAASRVDFAGGTLDLPYFAEKEKGATLNCSIAKYGYAGIKLNGKQLQIHSLNYNEVTKVPIPIVYNGHLDLLKSAFKYTNFKEKATLTTYHEMVPHSRLGTSSSISVAVLGAILRWQKKKIDRVKISHEATMMERNELHMDNGPQDQYAAAMGGILMLRYNGPKTTCEKVKLKDETLFELEKNMILCYMNSQDEAGDVNRETHEGYERGDERVVGAIKNIKEITNSMYKALKKDDLDQFAELLNEETKNRVRLNKDIVTPTCQKFLKIGLSNGAEAGKILGAGAGGTLLFYSKHDQREKLQRALQKSGGVVMDFRFDFEGLRTWEKNTK